MLTLDVPHLPQEMYFNWDSQVEKRINKYHTENGVTGCSCNRKIHRLTEFSISKHVKYNPCIAIASKALKLCRAS